MTKFLTLITLSLLLGCQPAATADWKSWEGRWIGPEGTYLEILPEGKDYKVMVQSLDSLDSYAGSSTNEGIVFERNGKQEVIHAGTGPETGMKWLMDKKTCLIIQTGEGFCR